MAISQDPFERMARRGHAFESVIDIGASDGRWSAALMRLYPASRYLLVEAQPVHEEMLRRFCGQHPNAEYVLAAAGRERGQIHFSAANPFGGQASYTPYQHDKSIVVPVVTIDEEVASRGLRPPYLLKLDTHGFEVPILDGCRNALGETEAIVMECYNFNISPECLLFHEMCHHLAQLGFRCIDLFDTMNRPYDGAFWQMDMVFVKKDRPEFTYRQFQ